ncbi:Stp1/IreP family PP2C-type Ser/Thr phosphatase [Petrocella sp. FN5]|uniref:Stp1/IreP family PP2C-type Ser/Thr phosphatase n=1 Tax=Petrocella sp. FN5 TaxID=3032002 RepID=UPI0023DC76B5|nr:Stp1/IreP family PP2C-type Ser/Thr phosphatase [Petrocella sp. FN5]MDF1616413.1 Stp1/IreP family PP2C-type Ser/Thr phosphatase [Petrocella sp. FN5]
MRSFALTDKGLVRNHNEDYYYVSDTPVGKLPNLYIIADGMGGHKAGDIASKKAIQHIVENVEKNSDWDVVQALENAVRVANKAIFDAGEENQNQKGMGTTIVACVIKDDTLFVTNVGDSRLYVYADGFEQVTLDHSVVEELYRAGHISEEDRYNHPNKNMITRALGAEEDVKVDRFVRPLSSSDLILLCSDGLNKMLSDDEVRIIMSQAKTIEDMGYALMKACLDKGGIDNITLIIINSGNEVQS